MKDYHEINTLEAQDKALEALWAEFSDVPMDLETECMEEQFLDFPAGTPREDIWHWFDRRHSKGIAYLLYGGAEDYGTETKRLYGLSKRSFECETEDCGYNHEGICRYALVHETDPKITEEDGCISGVTDFWN